MTSDRRSSVGLPAERANMTDDAELERLADEATPGPWYHVNPGRVLPKTRTVHGSVPAQRVDYVSTWAGPGTPAGNRVIIPMEQRESTASTADMAYIAAANPAVIKSILRERADLSRRLAEAEGALRWYAEQVAGCRKITSEGNAARAALDRDGGKRARAALNPETDEALRARSMASEILRAALANPFQAGGKLP